MDSSQVTLENIGAVKRLLSRGSRSRAEAAHHGTFVVSKGMAVFVVLPSEALDVVITCGDWALLRSLILVSEHMRLEVLERLAAVRVRASLLLLR
jgi:hypothetical protein